jgi:hypothetical protein
VRYMAKMVLGIFAQTEGAENAIKKLEGKGYNPQDISIVMRDAKAGQEVAENTGANVGGGAAAGATTGGVLGGLAGMLVAAGIIPGLGALFIGGPLVAALGLTGAAATAASGAATGALAGGVLGALGGLGLSGDEATEYETSIKEGGILVAVPVRDGNEGDVRGVLEEEHADKVRVS